METMTTSDLAPLRCSFACHLLKYSKQMPAVSSIAMPANSKATTFMRSFFFGRGSSFQLLSCLAGRERRKS